MTTNECAGEETIEDLSLQTAKLLIKLRKKIEHEQTSNSKYYYTYVLLLQQGNIYVGSTSNLYIRLMEHFEETSRSSQWVRMHGPVIRVLEVIRDSKQGDEDYKTLEWMSIMGYESVRGGCWNKVDLRREPEALKVFQRCRGDFKYMPRHEIDRVLHTARELGLECSM